MEKEFGLDLDGDICCRFSFTNAMEKLVPKNRTIEVGKRKNDGPELYFEWHNGLYYITENMIEFKVYTIYMENYIMLVKIKTWEQIKDKYIDKKE